MKLTIITKELHASATKHPTGTILDPQDINECLKTLYANLGNEIIIYDLVNTKTHKEGKKIPVNDHINSTGKNPIIGRQKALGVDFIDMTNTYTQQTGGVTTQCCGAHTNPEHEYPSHFLSNLVILAKALNYKKISAFLINGHTK